MKMRFQKISASTSTTAEGNSRQSYTAEAENGSKYLEAKSPKQQFMKQWIVTNGETENGLLYYFYISK